MQNQYNRDELLACAQGELFGEGNAKLPAPDMLMMDRIITITEDGGQFGKGHMLAELDIDPSLWFLAVISLVTQLCLDVSVLMRCGNWLIFLGMERTSWKRTRTRCQRS